MQTDNKTRRGYDYYGWLKLTMAIMIAIFHHNMLMGGSGSFIETLSALLGAHLPISFFVLSGVVIYKAYYDRIVNGIGFLDFLVRRVKRLYPMMWISIITFTVSNLIYLYHTGEWWAGRSSGLSDFFLAMTGISVGTFINRIDRINGPIWYISVLIVCYCIFYVLVRNRSLLQSLLQDNRMSGYAVFMIPIVVGLAIQNYGINLPLLEYNVSRGYISFFTGVVVMKVLDEHPQLLYRKPVITMAVMMLAIISILLFVFRSHNERLFDDWDYILCFVITPSLVILCERVKKTIILDNALCDYMGKISFPFFLLHIPVYLITTLFNDVYHIPVPAGMWNHVIIALLVSCMVNSVIGAIRKTRLTRTANATGG